VDDLVVGLQKARLLVFLRRFASFSNDDRDALLLIGLAVGLRLAAKHPEAAANILVDLGPPIMDQSLDWVVRGSDEIDPELPVN